MHPPLRDITLIVHRRWQMLPATRFVRRTAGIAAGWTLTACAGSQSALDPQGPAAAAITQLAIVLFVLAAVVVVAVIGALLVATFRRHTVQTQIPPLPLSADLPARRYEGKREHELHAERGAGIGDAHRDVALETHDADRRSVRWVVWAGVVFPAVVLVTLFVFTLRTLAALETGAGSALSIEVTGHQFWWEVRYPAQGGRPGFETANEIHIPVGRRVEVVLTASDVIHSFWVPRLHGKLDLIPGRTNRFWIQADEPGTYRGQCAEYCGVQHANMAFIVIAEPESDFEAWVRSGAQAAVPPADSLAAEGQRVFVESACAACHAIRGTPAASDFGPDLTHVARRRTLAALTLPNTRGHLGGWISNPQDLKPGSHMPAVPLEREQFHALLHYLGALR